MSTSTKPWAGDWGPAFHGTADGWTFHLGADDQILARHACRGLHKICRSTEEAARWVTSRGRS